MRTYTEEKTAYQFDELSDKAKERAVSDYREHSMHDGWWDCVYDDYKQKCEAAGFNSPKFQFSGFGSQGDGASFGCSFSFTGDEAGKFLSQAGKAALTTLQVELRLLGESGVPELNASGHIVIEDSRYAHANCMKFDIPFRLWSFTGEFSTEGYELMEAFEAKYAEGVYESILEAARDIADDLYRDLEKEYEYLTSEETVAEMSEANEWEYDEDGRMI